MLSFTLWLLIANYVLISKMNTLRWPIFIKNREPCILWKMINPKRRQSFLQSWISMNKTSKFLSNWDLSLHQIYSSPSLILCLSLKMREKDIWEIWNGEFHIQMVWSLLTNSWNSSTNELEELCNTRQQHKKLWLLLEYY